MNLVEFCFEGIFKPKLRSRKSANHFQQPIGGSQTQTRFESAGVVCEQCPGIKAQGDSIHK